MSNKRKREEMGGSLSGEIIGSGKKEFGDVGK